MKTYNVKLAFTTYCDYTITSADEDDAVIAAENLYLEGVAGAWDPDPRRWNEADMVEESAMVEEA
jgi:hypothetical protein